MLRSIGPPAEEATYCRLPKPEDPPQLQAHQRIEVIAERHEWQLVVYGVLDEGSFATLVKPVGVPPESIGATHLLVHEPKGRIPVRNARPPAERNPEQPQRVVDRDPFSQRDRLRRKYTEAQFRGGNTLQVGRIGEEGEDGFARQWHAHGRLEDMRGHVSYCSRRCFLAREERETMDKVTSRDGTPIAFDRLGDGPPVIVVCGAMCDRALMRPTAEELAKHFTVFNYDRRGRGESGDTTPYAIEREIEDIGALIAEAGGKASVYGHSSGAGLVLHAAAHGLPIAKIVLHDPPTRPMATRRGDGPRGSTARTSRPCFQRTAVATSSNCS